MYGEKEDIIVEKKNDLESIDWAVSWEKETQ